MGRAWLVCLRGVDDRLLDQEGERGRMGEGEWHVANDYHTILPLSHSPCLPLFAALRNGMCADRVYTQTHAPAMGSRRCRYDAAIDERDGAVGLGGDAGVVRHHDYSELLLGVQLKEQVHDFVARV